MDIMQKIPTGSKYFAKIDALQGYHQVPLAQECRHITTSLLPQGKFRYKRGPMGLLSTNDVFCSKTIKNIKNVKDSQKIVDDILICAPTLDKLFERIQQVLLNCRKNNIKISKKRF